MCRVHGGAAPQVRDAAARRVEEQAAEAVLRRVLDRQDADPIRDPAAALLQLAGRVQAALDAVGARLNDLEGIRYQSRQGVEQLRSEIGLWERLLARFESILVAVAKLGLEERQVRLEERQGAQIASAFGYVRDTLTTRLALDGGQAAEVHAVLTDALRVLAAGEPFPAGNREPT